MTLNSNIYLVGPMGVGKSTIGSSLAKVGSKLFYDSDTEIEKATGVDIPYIFDEEGEDGFRKRESKSIEQLCQKKGIVMATGGGAVISERNRRLLMNTGIVIYLTAPVESLLDRTKKNKNRPLLQCHNPKEKIEQLLKQRDYLYREVADYQIDTYGKGVQQITSEIFDLLDESY